MCDATSGPISVGAEASVEGAIILGGEDFITTVLAQCDLDLRRGPSWNLTVTSTYFVVGYEAGVIMVLLADPEYVTPATDPPTIVFSSGTLLAYQYVNGTRQYYLSGLTGNLSRGVHNIVLAASVIGPGIEFGAPTVLSAAATQTYLLPSPSALHSCLSPPVAAYYEETNTTPVSIAEATPGTIINVVDFTLNGTRAAWNLQATAFVRLVEGSSGLGSVYVVLDPLYDDTDDTFVPGSGTAFGYIVSGWDITDVIFVPVGVLANVAPGRHRLALVVALPDGSSFFVESSGLAAYAVPEAALGVPRPCASPLLWSVGGKGAVSATTPLVATWNSGESGLAAIVASATLDLSTAGSWCITPAAIMHILDESGDPPAVFYLLLDPVQVDDSTVVVAEESVISYVGYDSADWYMLVPMVLVNVPRGVHKVVLAAAVGGGDETATITFAGPDTMVNAMATPEATLPL